MPIWDEINKPARVQQAARDNYWFDSGGLRTITPNPSLKGQILADIVIIGGGFTGLASAFNLIMNHPDKKIVLLEASCCGYGASGRNGGFADAGMRGLWEIMEKEGPEVARAIYDITIEGVEAIRRFSVEHGVDCDLATHCTMEVAANETQMKLLEEEKEFYDKLGLQVTLIGTSELRKMIKSERYIGAIRYPYGATVHPFKLARGMKRVVEEKGVEIFEQTPALRVRPGKEVVVVTEHGEVRAATLVLATDGYSPLLGFFKNRIVPMCAHLIATAPLSAEQRESVGWSGKEKISDLNPIFDYFHLSADGRVIYGGAGLQYHYGGRICTAVHRSPTEILQRSLLTTFPQLEGIDITHRWGGSLGMTFDFLPSVGVLDEHRNMLYAVGYSGEGVVLTQVAGKIINELYSQNDNALTRLFFVNKPVPYALHEPLRSLAIWGFKQYVTHLRGRAIR